MTSKPTIKASDIPVYCSHDKLVDVVSLVPNPRNPNTHPDKQIALLAKIIRAQGWRNPIVVSTRSGFITKGHGRLQAAQLLQVELVPVDYQDYATEAAEWADMLADNRIAELAENDSGLLAGVLDDLKLADIDMDLTGYDQNEKEEKLEKNIAITTCFEVVVECSDENTQRSVYEQLTSEGKSCRLLTL
jgi:ParB-like chromosome segregation protein Spo0J